MEQITPEIPRKENQIHFDLNPNSHYLYSHQTGHQTKARKKDPMISMMHETAKTKAHPQMTMEQAINALSWKVDKVQIPNPAKPNELTPFYATIRNDTKQVFQAGLTKDYQVIQNQEMIDQANIFLGQLGGAANVSQVWSVNGGQSNALQLIGHPYHVGENPNDKIFPVFTFSNNHIGTAKTLVTAGTFRQICQNGMSIALGSLAQVAISHKGNIEEKIKQVQITLKDQITAQKYFRKILDLLNQTKVTEALVKSFLDEYLPNPEKTTQTENKKTMIEHYYHDADQKQIPKDTAYNLLQATTRNLNHDSTFRTRKNSLTDPNAARLQSIYQGKLFDETTDALETIIRLTETQSQIDQIIRETEKQAATPSYTVEDILAEMGA